MPRYAVIDIGSNSVRLMLYEEKTLEKHIETTRLSEGLFHTQRLAEDAMQRTLLAVARFYEQARQQTEHIFLFATEAVRSARNGQDFVQRVQALGLPLEVLTGEQEALAGFYGSLLTVKNTPDTRYAVIDIGGASTEITVGTQAGITASSSQPMGVVRLLDACGDDIARMDETVDVLLSRYPREAADVAVGIGGTATTLGAIYLQMSDYDPQRINGCVVSQADIYRIAMHLLPLSVKQRKAIPGVPEKRADVIAGGAYWLYKIMHYFQFPSITLSDTDNQEGFLYCKGLIKP